MKQLLTLLSCLTLLCLVGCSKDEPQSVAFSVKEITVSSHPSRNSITIEANCPWTITDEPNMTFTENRTGEGTMETVVVVPSNPDYETKRYTVRVTSEDGTSSDVLTIIQEEALGLEIGGIELIKAEGGEVNIPVATNEKGVTVETPDWLTFTTSRALKDYTYTFTAEPNKTGKPREGKVIIKGTENEKELTVKQDSYAPTGVTLQDDVSYICKRSFKTKVICEPEYADISKLGIYSYSGCNPLLEKDNLDVNFREYGDFNIAFQSEGKEIAIIRGEFLPINPLGGSGTMEAYLGQTSFLDYLYYTSMYQLQSSDPNVIQINEKGKPEAVGIGSAVISITHPKADCYDEMTVKVEPFLLEARIGWFGQKENGSFDVKFAARVSGPEGMSCSGYIVMDKDGWVKILNDETVSNHSPNHQIRIGTKTINVSFDHSKYDNIFESLKGYQFMAEVCIDGKVYQRTVDIDTHHVAFY